MLNSDRLYCYSVYGCQFVTQRSLPGLPILPARTAFRDPIRVNLLGTATADYAFLQPSYWQASATSDQQEGLYLWQTQRPDGIYSRLRSYEGGDRLDFVINPTGTEVWGFWSHEDLFQDAVSLLLGAVLGHVLRLRNVICLHASVVEIADRAIALVGESGSGKSTTAAAFALRGYSVLSDDIAALTWMEQQFWVQPGYPALRLWSPSLDALQVSTSKLRRVANRWDKRLLDLNTQIENDTNSSTATQPKPQSFTAHPLPLSAVYVLTERDPHLTQVRIDPLTPIAALHQLLTHAYGRAILSRSGQQAELQHLTRIAQTLPIRKLYRPDDLHQLDHLCAAITHDLEQSRSLCNPH